jgi:hypothetical protein
MHPLGSSDLHPYSILLKLFCFSKYFDFIKIFLSVLSKEDIIFLAEEFRGVGWLLNKVKNFKAKIITITYF